MSPAAILLKAVKILFFFLHPWKGTAPNGVATLKTKQAVGYSKDEGYVARALQGDDSGRYRCVQERVCWGLLVSEGVRGRVTVTDGGRGRRRELYILIGISGSDFLQDGK